MNFKGTKGEWHVYRSGERISVDGDDNLLITEISSNREYSVNYANAKLIAAAPELLEVCLMLEKFDDVELYSKEWRKLAEEHLKMCESAIKKALG